MKLQKGDIFRFLPKQRDCMCLYMIASMSIDEISFIRRTPCPKHAILEPYCKWWTRPYFLEGDVEVIDPFEVWVEEVRRENGLVD